MKKSRKKHKRFRTSGYTMTQLQTFFFCLLLLAILAVSFFIYKATTKDLILGVSTYLLR